MPIVSIFMGGIDFSEMKIVLPRLFGEPVLDDAGNVVLNTLNYGNFISAVINFLILALVVFFLVKSSSDRDPRPAEGAEISHGIRD